ncbi:MAG: alkaline shock response membrane anchor protein AmaP [Candidatus Omnitrophica bacterium]|nr:alkaline shock response membrane anchor protein AmaP [Candidatus Omnitrophota bacterium]MCM8799032.1 alkaline shock response membrane anchor protein AmaP [Candidatus Omnitrophota bacterium]
MRIIKRIITLVVGLFFIALSLFVLAVSLKLISAQDIAGMLELIGENYKLRLTLGIIGCSLMLFSFLGIQLTLGKLQREKTIAFTNPDGQVTVSLHAIEDFIHKIVRGIEEVKELKADVVATKKGIQINARVILWGNTDIPATTEKIQQLIKTRLQEMLSLEEAIQIKIHVVKIVEKPSASAKEQAPEIPFRSYEYKK